MIPLFIGRILCMGRKSESTISERQPKRASAVPHHDDEPRGPDHTSGEELDVQEGELELLAPFFFFQTHFSQEDGFEHVMGPFKREICYTEKTEGGEEVAVAISGNDIWLFQAAKKGKPWTPVNGIKQGGAVCIALSMLPPAFASCGLENAGSSPHELGITEAAFDAAGEAMLYTLKRLQNPDFEGSKPVPDEWLEGCLAMVCVGGVPRVYEYRKAKGLCDPQANTGWMLLMMDEELRRQHGLPLRPLLRDAESLSKSTKSQFEAQSEAQSGAQSKAQPESERTNSPEREVFSDPFPGVATPEEFLLSYFEHQIAKTANDATSFYSLRKRALEIPLALFQSDFPKEEGFEHTGAGPLVRDLYYTEVTEGGENLAARIPWDNTSIYVVSDRTVGGRITAFALYVLPPAPVVGSEHRNAETPWGRGISDATMSAASQELEEVIEQFQGPGYDGTPPAPFLESCLTLVFVGLEMRVGLYSKGEGVRWFSRGPVVADGYGLAAASDPSRWRLPPWP